MPRTAKRASNGRPPALRREVLRETDGGRELVALTVAIARDPQVAVRDRLQALELLAAYAWPEGVARRAALSQVDTDSVASGLVP